jgi:hypothetical protein
VLIAPMLSSGAIALNPIGQAIYAISASGLMILVLPTPLDQITPPVWPHAAELPPL